MKKAARAVKRRAESILKSQTNDTSNFMVIIDYFIIPLNDLAFAIALLAFWKGFR